MLIKYINGGVDTPTEDRKYKGMSLKELADALAQIAINDKNKELVCVRLLFKLPATFGVP